jgi:hypothetical protein
MAAKFSHQTAGSPTAKHAHGGRTIRVTVKDGTRALRSRVRRSPCTVRTRSSAKPPICVAAVQR